MKRNFFRFLFLSSGLLFLNSVYSDVPNKDDPSTFLGPTLKASYTSPLYYKDNAFSVLGEAGLKNLRVGGTFGWQFFDNQRFKFSAEYLRQNITYAFFSGNTNQWVEQWAVGGGYQWDIAYNGFLPQFDLDIFYSYAPNKNLGTVNGFFIDGAGNEQFFTDQRHIAGAADVGVTPGVSIRPWMGGKLSLGLNYDHVHYRKYYSPSENANGLGGTIRLNQDIYKGVGLDLAAAVRKPFNNYYAKLGWTPSYYRHWRFGVDGSYTVGKQTLPNTYNAGLDIDYMFDCPPMRAVKSLKGDLKAEAAVVVDPGKDILVNWVRTPAVYMPQVLAIADGSTTVFGCEAPDVVALGPIPGGDAITAANFTVEFPTAPSFNGNGSTLTFSMVEQTTMSQGATPVITINPTTGVVSVHTFDQPFQGISNITVTATNGCKFASSLLVVTYEVD